MTLPIENYLAAFPPVRTVRMGWLRRPVVLGPLTLGKCVLIDALGVNPCRRIAEKDAAIVAFFLSGEAVSHRFRSSSGEAVSHRFMSISGEAVSHRFTDFTSEAVRHRFSAFERRVKSHLKELCKAVNETMKDAFATYVKPQPPKGPAKTTPSGIGWWLSHAEALCGDYGWTWQQVLDMPLATVFALEVSQRERYGIDNGDSDYIERAYIKEHFKNG